MKKIDNEYCVSLEVAKLLKEAGFDWKVKFFYRDGILRSVLPDELFNGDFEDIEYYYKHIGIPHQSLNYNDGSSKFLEEYSAPTLDVAQRWLREVKRIFITVSVYAVIEQGHEITDSDKFSVYAETWDTQSEFWNKWTSLFEIDDFNTYEEAQEAGIKKVLELILKKGESEL